MGLEFCTTPVIRDSCPKDKKVRLNPWISEGRWATGEKPKCKDPGRLLLSIWEQRVQCGWGGRRRGRRNSKARPWLGPSP